MGKYKPGAYGYEAEFFAKNGIETVELKSADGKSKILIVPAYQGRVMTSTADGNDGDSYGWINHAFIESGKQNPQFNPTGGEERFWIGPEGGPFSFYFKKGDEQVYKNWKVPAPINTEGFDLASSDGSSAVFSKSFSLVNASGFSFSFGVNRKITLLDAKSAEAELGCKIPVGVKFTAFRTDNEITNQGAEAWTKETGTPSIWMLGMLNPSPTTTVFIPYNADYQGKPLKDDYFGQLPAGRLVLHSGMAYFKIDGKLRAKIGLPAGSAKDICGSYDSEKGLLTILKYTVPKGNAPYMNAQWGHQDDPFAGDVINSYNDGPTEDGTKMGPFYELETSSPGAALKPGESLTHSQCTMHFQGSPECIGQIVETVFGVSLSDIASRFQV